MIQRIIKNLRGVKSYTRGKVAAGTEAVCCDIEAPSDIELIGIWLSFGISDVTAWAGDLVSFKIMVNNELAIEIKDELCDLKSPIFFPLPLEAKQNVQLVFINGFGADLEVAATLFVGDY